MKCPRGILVAAALSACGPPPAAEAPMVVQIGKPRPVVAEPSPEPKPAEPDALVFGEPRNFAEPPPTAERTESGLRSIVIRAGTGSERPGALDRVTAHYVGWTTDGEPFDSSLKRGRPITVRPDQVIPGWTEGLRMMVAGEQRRFWIPAELAYGDNPKYKRPAGMLIFDIELLKVEGSPEPPKPPPTLRHPPRNAITTTSGLVYQVLSRGTSARRPLAVSRVEVHYSGWDSTGRLFDSSVTRGRPATFPLNRVIKGWTEGLQLMRVGDTFRFWIPPPLAYGNKPRSGVPAGTLVFDVELLAIK